MERLKERLQEQYAPLVSQFVKDIGELDVTGIPAPHIPIMGKNYGLAKYKMAFIGMETYGWEDINVFLKTAKENSGAAVFFMEHTINDLEHLGWAKNYHATFWGFVFKFIAKFYKVSFSDLVEEIAYPELLTSFVWGNTNSIERYDISAECNGVDYKTWEVVKKASTCFDSINNIVKSVNPKLFFVLNSSVDNDYIQNDDAVRAFGIPVENKKNVMRLTVDEERKIVYYYLRDDNVHIISMPHPTWMGLYSGFGIDSYVDIVIDLIHEYNIWDCLPEGHEDWKGETQVIDKSSMSFKRAFLADLAASLMKNNLVMSGKELQLLFNINNILTTNGNPFSEDGGRGIHKLITYVWEYYYHEKKDYQTAYNISRAFVNQNGEYAWG